MSPDHSISAATEEDLEELAALVNSAYRGESAQAGWTNEAHLLGGERINVKLLRAEMHAPGVTVLCLRQEEKLVGCVSLTLKEQDEKICYLGMLTVSPTRQNAKLSQRLMAEAEAFAQKSGAKRILLSVIQLRSELLAWYQRRGYRPTGEIQPFPEDRVRFLRRTEQALHFVMMDKRL